MPQLNGQLTHYYTTLYYKLYCSWDPIMHSVIITASCCECSGYTTCMDCNTTRELMKSHWTKTKISYMSCLPKHDISNTYLTENRAEFYANIIMICVENLALSYRFPTCMKFRFSSSGSSILSIRLELRNLSLTEATIFETMSCSSKSCTHACSPNSRWCWT